ncbi:hypothetical protein SESBI_42369 [Sesbania bispinosa]|nr:hypothetical protein SESBI_42369 [Sesbania bispinosa]
MLERETRIHASYHSFRLRFSEFGSLPLFIFFWGVCAGASLSFGYGGGSEEKKKPPEGENKVKRKMKTASQLEVLEKTYAGQ